MSDPERARSGHYKTADLAQATYLCCTGHLCEVVPSDQVGRVFFQFSKSEQLDANITAFASGEGKIAPTAYEYMRRELLRRVKR